MTDDRGGPPSHDVDVSVVMVSYNAAEWLPRSLEAVAEARERGRRSIEVVVVDNASTPPVRDYLATRPFGIRLVQLEENVGFARGCAAGAEAAVGRYLLFVNPDAVLEPGAIDALADLLDAEPQRGIVGGRTLRLDGALEPHSCWAAPSLWSWFSWAVGLSSIFRGSRLFDPEAMGGWQRDDVREVDIVTGCLLMLSSDTWTLTGGFDQDFFMYGEDAELSIRARRMGFRPSITPDAVATHANGASSSNPTAKQRLLLRGKVTLARKIWSPTTASAGRRLLVLGVGVRAVGEAVRRTDHDVARTLWRERGSWSGGYPPAAEHNPAQRAHT